MLYTFQNLETNKYNDVKEEKREREKEMQEELRISGIMTCHINTATTQYTREELVRSNDT